MTTKKEPRIVQIGLNLISLLDVNDKEHCFSGNVLTHVFWDAAPMNPTQKCWRPWIQVHNVKTLEEIKNDGMQSWERYELPEYVQKQLAEKPGQPVNVMESRNFVCTFVSTLNLRAFPFDQQALRITVMSNTTSDVTFTHKVPRDPVTKIAKPLIVNGNVVCTIKCNLEADTLSEWDVLLQNGRSLDEGVSIGSPAPAVVNYSFLEHDRLFSAEGAVYQRLDFYVYVERELKNMMFTIILPTLLLSFSSLCVFALDITDQRGDRFSVLFTVVLTIVANQFVSQGRLPYLAYFTWLDAVMLALQLFVYTVIVETATVESFALLAGMDVRDADKIALWVLLGIFGSGALVGFGSGVKLYWLRKKRMQVAEKEGLKSFDREERRLRKLWFPHEFQNDSKSDDANEVVVSVKQ